MTPIPVPRGRRKDRRIQQNHLAIIAARVAREEWELKQAAEAMTDEAEEAANDGTE